MSGKRIKSVSQLGSSEKKEDWTGEANGNIKSDEHNGVVIYRKRTIETVVHRPAE